MLHYLPSLVRGLVGGLLLAANTLFWCWPLFAVTLLKLCLPFPTAQRLSRRLMNAIHEAWISGNHLWIRLTGRIHWDVRGLASLDYKHSYLVTSNHQSWVDIFALQYLMNRHIRPLKFFLKQELIWVPIIGLCWWALDFPFMKRYSKAYLARHPEKRGKDLETTRRACARFRDTAVGIFNFLEGTRFTQAKHDAQRAPYRHLLSPRAGGIAFVLDAMGEQLHSLVNVTIHYPNGTPSLWDLLSGRIAAIVVRVEEIAIPAAFLGKSYDLDSEYRAAFQAWVNQLWTAKDELLERLHQEYPPKHYLHAGKR
ncbi:acyltransferase [Pseudomonas luteola]|uniref:acyltransferase n=1 Tax=Pseudomonas luteola TaxID=47886 RepID=UPI001EF5D4AA|nr:acyltransferase [Pseudomonas luteola]MCG7373352.1 acyltransferase [Pseudomonas luteola]